MFRFGRKKNAPDASRQKGRQISAPSAGIKGSLISLEQRLMFDAAASATASEVASEQVAQEQAEAAVSSDSHTDGQTAEREESQGLLDAIATYDPGESRTEVVFVDPTVPNYHDLIGGLNSHVEVIMLDGGQDGVEQMANALSGRTGIDAIHVISHGGAGELQLGTGVLNAGSMSTDYADDLAVIQQALSEQADILVYGCEFAQGEAGQAAVDMLAELTGADVQASTDLTGSISLGGDWEFEVSTGTIETSVAISYDTQMSWAEVLGTETVKDTFSTESYSNNNGTQSWASSWSETDASGGGASGGDVRVNSGQLRIDTDSVGNAVSRAVNLSGAASATLTFTYSNTLTGADRIEARVSNNGGATYTTLTGGVFSNALNAGSGTASLDLSGYASANTRIQFIVTGTGGGDRLYVDNVQVSYQTNTAPTITSNSGGATASVSVAENSSTVTTVGATDSDAGQALSYSIAGGADAAQFTINSSTGQLSFVSAPNYEAPTDSGGNNIYDVTVQVSDGSGGTDTQSISVTVSDVANTLSVTTTADTNDSGIASGNTAHTIEWLNANKGADGKVSLREAIIAANNTAGTDTISFNITDPLVNGAHTIALNSEMTHITDTIVIDGTTDSDYGSQGRPVIELNGTNAGAADGLALDAGSSGSTIRGLVINRFSQDGIDINQGSNNNTIELNRIGTDVMGLIDLGNTQSGVDLYDTTGNVIQNNVISGNNQDGVSIYTSDSNAIRANLIGVGADGTTAIGNSGSGIALTDGSINNLIGGTGVGDGNIIANSLSRDGIELKSSTDVGNRFMGNSIYGNAQLGIDLGADGVTANDAGDGDGGANHLKNAPVLTAATLISPTEVSVTGTYSSITVSRTYRVEFFANSTSDPSGYGEGQRYLGYTDITTDASGNATINAVLTASVSAGELISATLTDPVLNVTSEFGLNVTAALPPNTAPTDLSLSANSLPENSANGTVLGMVTATDANWSDTKTYSLTDTAGGRFAINASTGVITVADGSLLDCESAASHNLTVRVTDSGGLTYDETFTINLTNVNETPTDLSLSANTVSENAANGTVVGTVSGTDPDSGETKTYNFINSAGGRFAIDSFTGQITVAEGSLLNYESATSHSVTVRVTDSGGLTYDETLTINLTNVNEGPTGADAVVTLSEDTAHTLTTANFGFSDVDAGDTFSAVRIDTLPTVGTLTLSGVVVTAGQVISAADITAGRLVFSPAADANGTGYANLTFSVQDSHSTYDTAPNTLTFDVTAVNDTPTDLALSANSVAENAATGTVVGTVSGTDPDASDTKTYSLTDTAGGRFAINASTGVITVADGSLLNYEAAASHTIIVQVTDAGGLTHGQTFVINLTNLYESPPEVDGGDGGEQTLVASLFQKSPAESEPVQPSILSQPTGGDSGSYAESVNELRKPVEWEAQAVPPNDILNSGRNVLDLIHGGDENHVGGAGAKGKASTSLGQQDEMTRNPESTNAAPSDPRQVSWPSVEGTEQTRDDSEEFVKTMVAGLVGAALQGNIRKNEKMATGHGEPLAGDQEVAREQSTQEPNPDDQQAPPKAA